MHKLYGDGIHDDHPAIQELIDSGVCEVSLPAPENYYLITKPLVLPSNFRLVLPRFAEIRLADGANCVMLRNKWRSIVREDPIIYEGRDQRI
jgi:polygalacturonase